MQDWPGWQQLGIGQWRPYTSHHEEKHWQWCSTCESSVVAQEDYNTTEEHEVGEGNVRESSRCAVFGGAQGVVIAVYCASDGGRKWTTESLFGQPGRGVDFTEAEAELGNCGGDRCLGGPRGRGRDSREGHRWLWGQVYPGCWDSVVVGEKPEQSQSESQGWQEEQELPEHVRCLYEECRKRLTAEQAKFVRELLIEFADAFATHDLDIGRFTIFAHRIRTGKAMSLRKSIRRTPLGFDQEEWKTLKAMLDAKVIEPSQSEWASPPVLVRKKDGSWRYRIDFRGLNAVTTLDAYPLPLIEECIDSLADMQWFSTLDMNSGYWQIPVAEQDKENTAFITKYGLFHFLRMPFGLSNAPATFQRTMNLVLSGLIWVNVIVYLDDVNVISRTFQENLVNLRVVLSRFRKYGLKLKPRRCVLFKRETAFLGRGVDSAGVHMMDDHVKAVQEWPEPKNRKQVEQFLGFINYHRSFIQDLAKTTAPLYELTSPKVKWRWGEEHSKAFGQLKQVMTSVPVLGCPKADEPFILDTDASDLAIGGVLSQIQNGKERPISLASKVLNSAQRDYCTTRKELLAVVMFTRHFRHYLLGRVFLIRTDHASLVWLMRFKHPSGQLARWLTELAQ